MTRPAPAGTGRLARLGFVQPDRTADLLGPDGLGWWNPQASAPDGPEGEALILALAHAADPDLAVLTLHRLNAAQKDPSALALAVRTDAGFRDRLFGVLGASASLGDHLCAFPDEWRALVSGVWEPSQPSPELLREILLDAVGAPTDAGETWGSGGVRARGSDPDVVADLRLVYRRCLLRTVARDLSESGPAGRSDVAMISTELADLAEATVRAALAVAAAGLPADAPAVRLGVIGMGKCGGRELNYVSDVDVVFVAEPGAPGADFPDGENPGPALRTATTLASSMMRICQEVAWQVDAALRPEGKDGPLVRTLASHAAYYKQWARTWEFQALIKARPIAGDLDLGMAWMGEISPLVWGTTTGASRRDGAAGREGAVAEIRAMRQRVEQSLPAKEAAREIKLGPGGLRDIEFAVQLLQLVHGRGDATLRSGNTLDALRALIDGGYVGRLDGEALDSSYRFLRTVEHRLQLQRLRRTHSLPTDRDELRWLAATLGHRGSGDPVEGFSAEWARHAREVRRLHEKLFYRPLLEAVATVSNEDLRMVPSSAQARLEALGFTDPSGALRHVQALTQGVSRRAHIQRALLPAMLGLFADAPDPDAGLLAYRQVSDRLGATPWFLRLVRDEGLVAERLPTLLGTSLYVAELLTHDPEGLQLLADDAELRPRSREVLHGALRAAAARHTAPEVSVVAARALRRRELLRTAFADLLGLDDVSTVGRALTDVSDAVLVAALSVAERVVAEQRQGDLPMRMAIIGMGRLGGAEMSYSSDADVMFVHEPLEGASEHDATVAARAVAEELRRLLSAPAPDPPLGIDANLRPEGRQGPLVRSLGSYAEYYRRWSKPWEWQALLRARPVAGDEDLGRRFIELIDPLRYPAEGLDTAAITEIRRIKARVDVERLPRGADPATHTKLGRGGLADVEWTVQLLQLRSGASVPGLRTTQTIAALGAARDAGLVTAVDHDALVAAWEMAAEVRNALMLVRGRPSDQLPRHGKELLGVARAIGQPADAETGEFLDEYLRTMRHGRQAVERVFYA
ncbi:bifunctional [glutamine synthetase] adenylyltransferase/[glutamine synthetase]-adenylyl-L-tyrosine phosphorylase [Cryptosporangium phraense]|uniref:Bifunctional [glutamine synthetase] adenylyltransferase/[glutamine synthetase]-adenylyl-L-tyrosine phosphorylase n=1 Tax=Cryptosporangium phraense TaxID=2593070 RepID=A0A545AT61_9ACTN|nr:bifunctional [glutamine synthetase] adenylyltransferase/[glutamine synthetase]-adenylyl-L-tyrosine phosphorylase [Cryptosporangium phraense]TQS44529.1 bifunctional [glutamine synthetase] adenylyltransferase/[glutamine synthetase]-adenylyl-L-tyrosine phosphorylase [Cryptosporangium phraense]